MVNSIKPNDLFLVSYPLIVHKRENIMDCLKPAKQILKPGEK